MSGKVARITLVTTAALTGVAAVAGGIGLLVGEIQLPIEWLQDSPFRSYTLPGLALAIVVGGMSLLSAGMVLIHHPLGTLVSLAAGVSLVIFEVVEFAVLHYVSWLQPLFFAVGLVIAGLAVLLWLAGRRRSVPITPITENERQLTGSGVK